MNISLTQSMTNIVVTSGSQPPWNYTWKITDNLGVDTIFCADDYGDPYTYITFDITVSETEVGLTSGIINNPVGLYSYELHQMPEQYDFDLTKSIAIIQQGLFEIKKDL